jgi:hypothetical protein
MITPDDIAYALDRLAAKQRRYKLYADYYEGTHRLAFATDAFRNAFGYLFKEFCYNRCAAVVDAVSDRLTIDGWETDGEQDAEASPIEAKAAEIWRRNRMQKRQGEVHLEALRSGDAYLIVWPDEETSDARMTPNCGSVMQVVYDSDYSEAVAYAVKAWKEERGPNAGRWRVTVYEPEAISRYITTTKRQDMPKKYAHLIAYTDDEQPVTENPFGRVPVFHFATNANTGCDGISELADVIPLQDALNKSVMDGLIAAEFLGFPQRVVTGLTLDNNPLTGLPEKPFDVAMDRLIVLTEVAAKWGQFDAADMGQFTNTQDAFDIKIARVSRVPVHWLNQTGNNFSSGEALKTAEGPLISKIKDRQVSFGDTWADAMQFALEIEATAGDVSGVQPLWTATQTRSELDELNAAVLKSSIGIPPAQIWTEMGYTADEVKAFQQAKDTAMVKQAENLARTFNSGGNFPANGGTNG